MSALTQELERREKSVDGLEWGFLEKVLTAQSLWIQRDMEERSMMKGEVS